MITFIIIITVIVIIITVFSKSTKFDTIINYANEKSEYNPTRFIIYDKSTTDVCNRLIVVEPFDWVIFANNNELYVLNPEGNIRCALDRTPAVRVFENHFVETCLNMNYDVLKKAYDVKHDATVHYIPYEITTNKFTILDALNILVKSLITFRVERSIESFNDDENAAEIDYSSNDESSTDEDEAFYTTTHDEHKKRRNKPQTLINRLGKMVHNTNKSTLQRGLINESDKILRLKRELNADEFIHVTNAASTSSSIYPFNSIKRTSRSERLENEMELRIQIANALRLEKMKNAKKLKTTTNYDGGNNDDSPDDEEHRPHLVRPGPDGITDIYTGRKISDIK